jgi:hypothetical protein
LKICTYVWNLDHFYATTFLNWRRPADLLVDKWKKYPQPTKMPFIQKWLYKKNVENCFFARITNFHFLVYNLNTNGTLASFRENGIFYVLPFHNVRTTLLFLLLFKRLRLFMIWKPGAGICSVVEWSLWIVYVCCINVCSIQVTDMSIIDLFFWACVI